VTTEKIEKVFLTLTAAMLLLFLGALFYSAFGMGVHLPDREGEIHPAEVRSTPPFDEPGVREVGPGRYEVVLIAAAWAFTPREIRVPAGAEVTFISTSTDVIHGVHVEGTRANFMVIPGHITRITTSFREPGEHLIICHEFCGAGHHLMYGTLIVE
jgi:cytochrome c oxidase subunit II